MYIYRFIFGNQSIRKQTQLVRLNYNGACGHYIWMKKPLALPDTMYEVKKIPINKTAESIESVYLLNTSIE
jgi:hypothetical protein